MSTSIVRQPAGTPTGGQFATNGHAETGTTLTPAPAHESTPEVVAARDALARAVGVVPGAVTVETDDHPACGKPAGSVRVDLSADLPGDPLNQEVSIGFYLLPGGGTNELACRVVWDRPPIPGLEGYTRDSTETRFAPGRTAGADDVRATVLQIRRQGALQRALDSQINDPQTAEHFTSGRRGSWWDILRAEAHVSRDGDSVVFTDHRSGRQDSQFTLDVDAQGHVTRGWMDTRYGTIAVTDESLDGACARLENELRWVTGDRRDDHPTREQVEARLHAVLTSAR